MAFDPKYIQSLEGHSDEVVSIIQLNDNKLASGSYDNTIKVWDLTTSPKN